MRRILLAAALAVAPMAVGAACVAPELSEVAQSEAATPPTPPAAELVPVLPDCLRGLSAPNQENCSAEDVAAYATAVATYQQALSRYIAAADRYANESVRAANAAIEQAQEAQVYADRAFDYANCEAERLRAETE